MEPNTVEKSVTEIKDMVTDMGKTYNEFKGAHATLLDEVKKLNTEDGVLKESIRKMTDDFAKKHEEYQKQMDLMETKMGRSDFAYSDGKGGVTVSPEVKMARDAEEFTKIKLIREKKYMAGDDLTVDVDAFKSFNKIYTRWLRKGETQFSAEEHKALSVGSDPDGGIFVRPEFSSRIITRIFESSPMRALATIETIGGSELKIPVDPNEASCGWVGEQQTRSTTNTPQVNEKTITVHELYAKPRATQALLEDGAIDMERWLGTKVSDKMGRVENTAFVAGTGITQPRGFLTYPSGTSWGQIQQIGSTSSGAFKADALVKIVGSLKDAYIPRAVWLMQRVSVPLIMILQDGNGRYIFQPIFEAGYNNVPLLGHPIRYANDMPVAGAGSLSAAFGDFGSGYTIVDRIGISVLRDPYSAKPFVEFYTRKRVGGDVVDFDAIKLNVLT